MKRSFFQPVIVSILLYGCTIWTLTKRLEKRFDGNYTRILRAILNRSWRQHPTKHQLYDHLPSITKTIQIRRTRNTGHCWRSMDELISHVLQWTPSHGRAKAGRTARTYTRQLCKDTGSSREDLPKAMNDRETWRERVRDIRADGTKWWWGIYIYICVCVCVCVVPSISFLTFFVQAFKISVESWKVSMILLYILWDDWPIFMISGSNQQLQQQLEYTLWSLTVTAGEFQKCNLTL